MKKLTLTKVSKFLSLILRHNPEAIKLTLDKYGWAKTKDLLKQMNDHGTKISMEFLEEVVNTDNKQRYSFNENKTKIKANQGHSIKIELNLEPKAPPELLFHGTASKSLDSIFKNGLSKQNRHHVHLSLDEPTAVSVGARHGKPVVLTINSKLMHDSGYKFYQSENRIWLTDNIPANFITFSGMEK